MGARGLLGGVRLLGRRLLTGKASIDGIGLRIRRLGARERGIRGGCVSVLGTLGLGVNVPLRQGVAIISRVRRRALARGGMRGVLSLGVVRARGGLLGDRLDALGGSQFLPSLGLVTSCKAANFNCSGAPGSFLGFCPVNFTNLRLACPLFGKAIARQGVGRGGLRVDGGRLRTRLVNSGGGVRARGTLEREAVTRRAIVGARGRVALTRSVCRRAVLRRGRNATALASILLTSGTLHRTRRGCLSTIVSCLGISLRLGGLTKAVGG